MRYKLLEQTKEAKQKVSVLKKKLSEYPTLAAVAQTVVPQVNHYTEKAG
jgi:hypothetical protein